MNYTAAQSEMMLPLLKRGMKRRRELARNRFCLVGEGTDFVPMEREGASSKPEIKKSFSTIDHGRRCRRCWRRGGAEGHDRCQRGVMAMNFKSSRVCGAPLRPSSVLLCIMGNNKDFSKGNGRIDWCTWYNIEVKAGEFEAD